MFEKEIILEEQFAARCLFQCSPARKIAGQRWHVGLLRVCPSATRYQQTLTPQLAACSPNTWPLPSFPCAFNLSSETAGLANRFDSAVASCGYYRQRATGHHRPAAREHSHLVRLRQRALHLLSACISGSQALMKGGRNDHI